MRPRASLAVSLLHLLPGLISSLVLLAPLIALALWGLARLFSIAPLLPSPGGTQWPVYLAGGLALATVHTFLGRRPRALRNGFTCHDMAHRCLADHDFTQAAAWLERSIESFEKVAERNPIAAQNLAADLDSLGVAYRHVERLDAAAAAHLRSLDLFRTTGNTQSQALVSQHLANLFLTRGEPSSAHTALRDALALARQAGDPWIEAASLDDLATFDEVTGRFSAALEGRRRSVELFHEIGAGDQESLARARMVRLHLYREDVISTIEESERAIVAASTSRQTAEPLALLALAALGTFCEDADGAIAYLDRLLHDERIGELEGACLFLLGSNHALRADADALLQAYHGELWDARQSLFPWEQPPPECDDFIGIGAGLHWGSQRAEERLTQRLLASRTRGDRAGTATHLRQLSALAAHAGDWDRARSLQEDAARTAREHGLRRVEVACRCSAILQALQARRPAEAGEHAAQLDRLLEADDEHAWRFETLLRAGQLARLRGRSAEARAHHEAALVAAQGSSDRVSEVRALAVLGRSLQSTGAKNEAAECFSRAIARLEAPATAPTALRLSAALTECQAKVGVIPAPALDRLVTEIDQAQERLLLPGSHVRVLRYLPRLRARLDALRVRSALERSDTSAAWTLVARAKGRALLPLRGPRSLFDRSGALTGSNRPLGPAQGLWAGDVDEGAVRRALCAGGRRRMLVEYHRLGEEILLFALPAWDATRRLAVTLDGPALRGCLSQLELEVCAFGSTSDPPSQTWSDLATQLLDPLVPYLSGCDGVWLVPDGPLWRLPLHAVPVAGRPLVAHCSVAYAPSAAAIASLHSGAPRRWNTACVLGNPSGGLEHASTEAIEVARLFGVRPLLAGDARMQLWEEPRDEDVLHVAAHAYFEADRPFGSGLAMADGLLTVEQVLGLTLRAELVTLSACDTAATSAATHPEHVSLCCAFLAAGARSVIASLWPVDDAAAMAIMTRTYSRLRQGECTLAEALRSAQLEVAASPSWGHPYFWAPFTLMGDPS